MIARLFLGQSEKLGPVAHGSSSWKKKGVKARDATGTVRMFYAVSFVSVSFVWSMDPPHPQPGPQQQQLKSRFTSVSQLLF
jgi:hypothetical protein